MADSRGEFDAAREDRLLDALIELLARVDMRCAPADLAAQRHARAALAEIGIEIPALAHGDNVLEWWKRVRTG